MWQNFLWGVGLVALTGALGFHLEIGLLHILQNAGLGWHSGELCSLDR